ncbi:flagellar basal-body MS-ring/collar protein FliF [Celerinatantimonas sp. MCCC 1A17872]|uniref:flagellar basal-body MS-ring/collar protein FliF n=1 Tax=Celerinatantimonas sp. MCCC 1A17872 TaxID=3177514 RepID=UPI0038CC0AB0
MAGEATDTPINDDTALLTGPDSAAVDLEENEQQSGSRLGFLQNGVILRQIIMILALAICLALGVFLLMWAKQPEMRPIGTYTAPELVKALDFFDQNDIKYDVEGKTVFVRADQYSAIRLKMLRGGVASTPTQSDGDDILLKDMGFGVSQRLEQERLKLSRERQLESAITQIQAVSKAKVLLAIPRYNVFARDSQKPSATVVVTLKNVNLGLKQNEVDSIVDMVASAVQDLTPQRVTVTDQNGQLLNSGSESAADLQNRRQLQVEQNREQQYKDKIDSILTPVLGAGNYTAQVDVSMDFTSVVQTQKSYNPDLPAIRSEMTVQDNSSGQNPLGIPGALSNQPPAKSDIPETQKEAQANQSSVSGRSHKEETRNYELDTTISHTRQQVGVVRRLSVSVAVDYVSTPGADGQVTRAPRSAEEMANIRRLLEGGIGFDMSRGDTLEVVSVPFTRPQVDTVKDLPVWEQDWFWRAMRIAGAVLVLVVLILAVVRPTLNRLLNNGVDEEADDTDLETAMSAYDTSDDAELLSADITGTDFGIQNGQLQLPDMHRDEDILKAVRALVSNEPDLAAMVIKDWVINDGK